MVYSEVISLALLLGCHGLSVQVVSLRRQADAAKRAQQSALRKGFQQHQGHGSRDYNDSDEDEGGRNSAGAQSHASTYVLGLQHRGCTLLPVLYFYVVAVAHSAP